MKPRVAFFDFASCEGCQLAILNCEDILLDILGLVDIVEFREAISEKSPRFDVAFIEGSVNREMDMERLREIRARATYLVSLGACACQGNVQARSNFVAPAENYKAVYGGCNSVCVNGGYVCDGCRGLLPHANVEAHKQLMREHEIPEDQMLSRYRLFNSNEAIGKREHVG